MDATAVDLIGTDDEPGRRRSALLAAAAAGLVAGLGLGVLWSPLRTVVGGAAPVSQHPRAQADGGIVHVCDGRARAFVFARGLPSGRTEVHLPLRGDDVPIPLLTDDADVLTGTARGPQYFVPYDGSLVVTASVQAPSGRETAARIGERELLLPVLTCGDRTR